MKPAMKPAMKPVTIIGAGTGAEKDLQRIARLPAFRKATGNMMLAFAAIEEALATVVESPQSLGQSFGMVLGTSLGELDVTQDFLGTLAGSGVARPILFQSSLHNATIGFLALHLGITGPCLTVSGSHCTGEKAIETAMALLSAGMIKFCLTVGVERQSQALAEPMRFLDNWGRPVADGAGALLLANDDGIAQLRARASVLGYIDGIDYQVPNGETNEPTVRSRHDSDAVEQLASIIKSKQVPSLEKSTLVLRKPSGPASLLKWRSA